MEMVKMGKLWLPSGCEDEIEDSVRALPTPEEVTHQNSLFDDSVPGGVRREVLDKDALNFNIDYMRRRKELQRELVARDLRGRKTHHPGENECLTIRSWDGKGRWRGRLVSQEALHIYSAEWKDNGSKRRGKVFYRGGEIAEEVRDCANMRSWFKK